MKHAKVRNGKIIDIIVGSAPADYDKEVIRQWVKPEDYPGEFYTTKSPEAIPYISGDEVHEDWAFELMSVEQIKDLIYNLQKEQRYKNQLGSFDVSGVTVTLVDRDDYKNIINLDLSVDDPYKVKNNVWIESDPDRTLLVANAKAHIREAFKTERDDNNTVNAMNDIEDLKVYFNSM